MKMYRPVSLSLAAVFAVVGLIFLSIPDKVLVFFNNLSQIIGMTPAPVTGFTFYLILAAAYMYLVTVLAVLMYRHPENRYFPFLLAQAKLASSVLSLALYLLQANYLIYFANFVIDGAIGIVALTYWVKMKEGVKWASR